MNPYVEAIRLRNVEAEAANEALAETRAEVSRLAAREKDEIALADRLRERSLSQRAAAANSGGRMTGPSAAEILEADMNAQATKGALEAVRTRVPALEKAAKEASERLDSAEIAYLIHLEEAECMAEVDRMFHRIAKTCARAIAAGEIVHFNKGLNRSGLTSNLLRDSFGPAGQLVETLSNISWPSWPVTFEPQPFQRYLADPRNLNGVAEERAALIQLLEEMRRGPASPTAVANDR